MGLSPRQVDALSLWEFSAMAHGFALANGAKPDDAMTPEDLQRLAAAARDTHTLH